VRDPFSPRLAPIARRDPRRCRLWPWYGRAPLPVDAYAVAGRRAGFPRPACPLCGGPLVFWSGYRRYVREAGRCVRIFVPRVRCGRCRVSHALLPAFVLAWRLDVAEVIGGVVAEVAGGRCGVRPAAERAGVPYTTARGWVRRFAARARAPGRDRHGLDACAGQNCVGRCGELPGPVADQEPEAPGAVSEIHQEIADLLGGPGAVRVRGDFENVHVAGADLDDESAIHAPERHGAVHVEEVHGKDRRGLRVQELPPRGVGAPLRSWGSSRP